MEKAGSWDLRLLCLSYQLTVRLEMSPLQNPVQEACETILRADIYGLFLVGLRISLWVILVYLSPAYKTYRILRYQEISLKVLS